MILLPLPMKRAMMVLNILSDQSPLSSQQVGSQLLMGGKEIEQQPDMVAKSYVVTGISHTLDGSDDGIVGNVDVQDQISAQWDNPQ